MHENRIAELWLEEAGLCIGVLTTPPREDAIRLRGTLVESKRSLSLSDAIAQEHRVVRRVKHVPRYRMHDSQHMLVGKLNECLG